MATIPEEYVPEWLKDDDGDGVMNRDDPDSTYYQEQQRKKQNDPQADEDGDGIKNKDDPDSTYYQQQQQAQQAEQQTIALQEQAGAAQTQTVVIAVGLVVIAALLFTAVFIIARKKKATSESAAVSTNATQAKKERSGIKAFGVWFGSAAIIQLIAGTIARYTIFDSRVDHLLLALCGLGMMVIPIVIAVRWKHGKFNSDANSWTSRWWLFALLTSIVLAIIIGIASTM